MTPEEKARKALDTALDVMPSRMQDRVLVDVATAIREAEERGRREERERSGFMGMSTHIFGFCEPDASGIEIKLPVREWKNRDAEGYELNVSDIPKQVTMIRFYNSWWGVVAPYDLERHLDHLGWTGAVLSSRLGVDPDMVTRWRRGRVPVPGYIVEYLRVMVLAKEMMEK